MPGRWRNGMGRCRIAGRGSHRRDDCRGQVGDATVPRSDQLEGDTMVIKRADVSAAREAIGRNREMIAGKTEVPPGWGHWVENVKYSRDLLFRFRILAVVRPPSWTNSVRAFSSAFEGLNAVVHLLADVRGDEPAHAMGLPAGQGHNGFERGAYRMFEKRNHARRLRIRAHHNRLLGWTGRFTPAGRFVAACGRVCTNVGLQLLDSPPNPAYTCLPVCKLGDFHYARQVVPNVNQPAARPVRG